MFYGGRAGGRGESGGDSTVKNVYGWNLGARLVEVGVGTNDFF